MNKNLSVEFFRFILIIGVLFCHIFGWFGIFNSINVNNGQFYIAGIETYKNICNIVAAGRLGLVVEFFFIISGFFFYSTKKELSLSKYFKIKLIRLYPLFFFFYFTMIITLSITNWGEIGKYSDIFRLLLLQGIIQNIGSNSVKGIDFDYNWFVPIIFWLHMLYFYITKNFKENTKNVFIFVITLFSINCVIERNRFINSDFSILINYNFIRGLASFGIGYFFAMFYEKHKREEKISKFEYFINSILEVYILIFLINNMLLRKFSFNNNFIFIIFFLVLFYLFLNQRGILSTITNNRLSKFLGESSYSIYVMHGLVLMYLKFTLFSNIKFLEFTSKNIYLVISSVTILCIFVGVLAHFLIEKPIQKILINKLNQTQ